MTGPHSLVVQHAWLGGEDLASNVHFVIEDGLIAGISPESMPASARRLPGVALPGLVNTHSHAFHRLLRGQTHEQGGNFWAWRDRMYDAAANLSPDRYEQIASAVFVEMALAGVTMVGEFHYLHHQAGGIRYEDPNEMGHALIRAARNAGIRICLLDACYLVGGLSEEPLNPVQERFSDGDVEDWLERVDDLRSAYGGATDVTVGLAPHSVRAVPKEGLRRLAASLPAETPTHIHLSEQQAENDACRTAYGLTPTELLGDLGLLGSRTTAVHSTHVTDHDISLLGESGTGVCYCPTTERDLADGIGPTGAFRGAGLMISVGSDSHAVIDLFDEARGVELHERLRSGRRGTFAAAELTEIATVNGAQALGSDGGRLEVGAPADLIIVSLETPRTAGAGAELAGLVFSASAADVTDVMVAGEWIVEGGHHPGWEKVRRSLG